MPTGISRLGASAKSAWVAANLAAVENAEQRDRQAVPYPCTESAVLSNLVYDDNIQP